MADKKMIRSEASSSSSNSNNGRGESVVVDVGRRRSSCGYCKSGSRSSITHGLWAHSLTVDDYQALLDRGCRRSGCFLYKPEMEKTCCPSYTIRLKASDFVPSKEQVRVAKRMQRFLDGKLNVKKPDEHVDAGSLRDSCCLADGESMSPVERKVLVDNEVQKNNLEQVTYRLSEQIDSVVHACIQRGEFPSEMQFLKASVKSVAPAKRKLQAEGSQDLLYSSNISFQIAAALRRANKSVRLLLSTANCTGKSDQCAEPNPNSIAEELSNHLKDMAANFGFSVKACNGHINFYSTETQTQPNAAVGRAALHKGYSKGSGSKRGSSNISRNFQATGQNLEICLKRSCFDPEEYALYRRYQIIVHSDTPDHITESSYRRFLVDSPLVFVPSSRDCVTPPCGFGSFHQQYRIDGKLVAVGVMDILPKCLSSKYLFWDPDFAFLSLGKYSALQEINWVRENQNLCPSLQYYYLGYYIHSCKKMKYKAAYHPSELLCPLRYQWVPFDIANRLLDRKPYVVLSDFSTLQNEESLLPNVLEDHMEQEDERCLEESNDVPIDDDEEMSDLDSEDSDDELGPETPSLMAAEMRKDINNIVIGLKGMHLRYKDIQQAFGPNERNYLETQLHKYIKAVGTDLSELMIYSLG